MTFEGPRTYRIRLRVTQSRIETWIDSLKVIDLATKGHWLSTFPGWRQIETLGIGSWNASVALRDIRLRRIGGRPDAGATRAPE